MREERAAAALAALGNRTRLRLFRLLIRAGSDGLNVGEVQKQLGIPLSTLGHHLANLQRAGLIAQERRGREVVSRASYPEMQALIDYLTEKCCTGIDAGRDDTAA